MLRSLTIRLRIFMHLFKSAYNLQNIYIMLLDEY